MKRSEVLWNDYLQAKASGCSAWLLLMAIREWSSQVVRENLKPEGGQPC